MENLGRILGESWENLWRIFGVVEGSIGWFLIETVESWSATHRVTAVNQFLAHLHVICIGIESLACEGKTKALSNGWVMSVGCNHTNQSNYANQLLMMLISRDEPNIGSHWSLLTANQLPFPPLPNQNHNQEISNRVVDPFKSIHWKTQPNNTNWCVNMNHFRSENSNSNANLNWNGRPINSWHLSNHITSASASSCDSWRMLEDAREIPDHWFLMLVAIIEILEDWSEFPEILDGFFGILRETWRILGDSLKIPGDSWRFLEILGDTWRISKRLCRILWDSRGCLEILGVQLRVFGILWDSLGFSGVPEVSWGFSWTLLNHLRSFEILWDAWHPWDSRDSWDSFQMPLLRRSFRWPTPLHALITRLTTDE